MVESDIGDYDGAGYMRSGSAAGVVVAYATPDLKQKQLGRGVLLRAA